MRRSLLGILVLLPLVAVPARAQEDIRTERVAFKPGATGATVKGFIKGPETVDYKVAAKAGQTMTVSLRGSNRFTYFNVLPPGSAEAIFVGASATEQRFEGALPASGDYTVRVFLMRNAARRDESSSYALTVSLTAAKPAAAPR